jgi:PAS domain S-box-containing protein
VSADETIYELIFESAPHAMWVQDRATLALLAVNDAAARLFGCPRAELVGRTIQDLYGPQRVPPGFASGEGRFAAAIYPCGGAGRSVDVEVTASPIVHAGKAACLVVATEASRDASERRFSRAFDSGRVGAVFSGAAGEIRDANEAFLRMIGYSRGDVERGDLTWGRLAPEGQPQPSRDAVPLLRRLGTSGPVEEELLRKDGTSVPVLMGLVSLPIEGADAEYMAFVLDRTPAVPTGRRPLTAPAPSEEQLRQAQKMDAIGRLAGGVAHDFNNLLTAITGYSELLLVRLAEGDPFHKEVLAIHKAGQRAASLTRQLLAFSRKQVLMPRVLDLEAVVGGLGETLRGLLGEGVELTTRHAKGLDPVNADPGQLEQMILNLAINGRDAMAGGGKLTLETRNVRLDEIDERDRAELAPGDYVLLSVSDTGAALSAEAQARVFEPFFAARAHGKGAGLGLATIYGIAKQSGGHVTVSSERGRGSTFSVYLPSAGPPASDGRDATPGTKSRALSAADRGRATVLVVEDDDMVRSLVREVLKAQGYRVLEATDGAAGLQVAKQHQGAIDLLLTDVVLPRIGGRDLAGRVATLRPGIGILFMSGYTNHDHREFLGPGANFLPKPFSPAALAEAVRGVLEGGRP